MLGRTTKKAPKMKEWTRSETIALALDNCTTCHGVGVVTGRRGANSPCNCVLRGIFRVCYNRFRYCVEKDKHIPRTTLEVSSGKKSTFVWGRKEEEYVADFYLVARRTLRGAEWDLFRYHFLMGADWRLCCRKMGLDRGNFFHGVYRVEQKLGRTFRDLEPYALFPLDEYFGGTVRKGPSMAHYATHEFDYDRNEEHQETTRKVVPLRAPLAKAPGVKMPEEKAA